MSLVLEASAPRAISTASNYYNEWSDFIDQGSVVGERRHLNFPDLYSSLVERVDGTWVLVNGDTSVSGRYETSFESDIVDDVESPVMPPKRKLKVFIKVTQVKKGWPSECDEVGW